MTEKIHTGVLNSEFPFQKLPDGSLDETVLCAHIGMICCLCSEAQVSGKLHFCWLAKMDLG